MLFSGSRWDSYFIYTVGMILMILTPTQSFPEPPPEEIRRRKMCFLDAQRQSVKDFGGIPPNGYDERWREYNERLPQ
jgi:hypothetical protein